MIKRGMPKRLGFAESALHANFTPYRSFLDNQVLALLVYPEHRRVAPEFRGAYPEGK
jgi:hypothetical protein